MSKVKFKTAFPTGSMKSFFCLNQVFLMLVFPFCVIFFFLFFSPPAVKNDRRAQGSSSKSRHILGQENYYVEKFNGKVIERLETEKRAARFIQESKNIKVSHRWKPDHGVQLHTCLLRWVCTNTATHQKLHYSEHKQHYNKILW